MQHINIKKYFILGIVHFFFCIFYIIGFVKLNFQISERHLFSFFIINVIMSVINIFYEKYIYKKIINIYNIKLFDFIFNVKLILSTLITNYLIIKYYSYNCCSECGPSLFCLIIMLIIFFGFLIILGLLQNKKHPSINLIFLFIAEFFLYLYLVEEIRDLLTNPYIYKDFTINILYKLFK